MASHGENQHTVGRELTWRDEDTLRELYVEKGMSSREVADELGCGKKAVLRWLDKHDIPKETPTHERPPTFQRLKDREQWKVKVDGTQYAVLHHRLLAVAEWGFDAVKGKIVHHKNGLGWDNRVENLELLDSHAEHMRIHLKRGDLNNKLTEPEVREIRQLYDMGFMKTEIADKYDVSTECIHRVVNRKSWKHVE